MTAIERYETGDFGAIEQRLIATFCPPLQIESVRRCLVESLARFQDAPVQTYVPVLVERQANDRLRIAVKLVGIDARDLVVVGQDGGPMATGSTASLEPGTAVGGRPET